MAYENNNSEQSSVYYKNTIWLLRQKRLYNFTKTIPQNVYFTKIIKLQKT